MPIEETKRLPKRSQNNVEQNRKGTSRHFEIYHRQTSTEKPRPVSDLTESNAHQPTREDFSSADKMSASLLQPQRNSYMLTKAILNGS